MEGFHPVYDKEKTSYYSYFDRKKFPYVMTCGFHFERLISQNKILWIQSSPEGCIYKTIFLND